MLIIWLSLQYFTAQCIKIYKKDSFETYQEILKEIGKIGKIRKNHLETLRAIY